MLGSPFNTDVYVLEWGKGKNASSFTDMIITCNKYYGLTRFHSAWTKYMANGGVTLNFLKFSNEDANIRNSKWWKKLQIINKIINKNPLTYNFKYGKFILGGSNSS